jgi:uncharacterized protein YaaN involved in tellurite resistance
MAKKDDEKKLDYAFAGFVCGVAVMTIAALYDQNQNLRRELVCANDLAQHNFDYWKVLTDFVTNSGLAKESLENYNQVFAEK